MSLSRDPEPICHLPAADASPWCSLRFIHLAVSRSLDAELQAAHHLTLSEYELLRALASPNCAQRMAGLAMMVGLSPSGLTRAIERLERRGLVQRVPCPVDRRGASAVLSDAGRELLQHATTTHDTTLQHLLLEELTAEEGETLRRLQARVAESQTAGSPLGSDRTPVPHGPEACDSAGPLPSRRAPAIDRSSDDGPQGL